MTKFLTPLDQVTPRQGDYSTFIPRTEFFGPFATQLLIQVAVNDFLDGLDVLASTFMPAIADIEFEKSVVTASPAPLVEILTDSDPDILQTDINAFIAALAAGSVVYSVAVTTTGQAGNIVWTATITYNEPPIPAPELCWTAMVHYGLAGPGGLGG